jgi:putative oxygen-independent coproporphyrinogen III oxidase
MSGIYIHIPFCKTKCHYCNFVSIASQKQQPRYVNTLIKEIYAQSTFFNTQSPIETIYFGGGTPSLLSIEQIKNIVNAIYETFKIANQIEITFELNPDDSSPIYLEQLREAGINRLSIGIQSFHQSELDYLKRRHSAKDGINSITQARNAGFENISIDFMYGLPSAVSKDPMHNIETAENHQIEHISAYALTLEPHSIMEKLVKNKKMQAPDDSLAADHFLFYMNTLTAVGYEHYEISNFAKPTFRSKHNSSYWKHKPYLGVGAGAHSYNTLSRYSNTPIVGEYISGMEKNKVSREVEILSQNDKYNDYVITSIRTSEGTCMKYIRLNFGEKYEQFFKKQMQNFQKQGMVTEFFDCYILTETGKLFADKVTRSLIKLLE